MGLDVLLLLAAAAIAAGWVDAVVGGGGLLLLPALMVALPGAPAAQLLGTNKLAAIFGTASAAFAFLRSGLRPSMRITLPAAGLALAGAGAGAALASAISSDALRPIVIAVLAVVLAVVILRPSLGAPADAQPPGRGRTIAAILLVGVGIAFYDGIVGPGTGTFLVLALSAVARMDFVSASASAKIVNTATNLGALAVFAAQGSVLWALGLLLAVGNIAGAQVGARMALARGTGFVRAVLVVVVAALLVRMAVEEITGVL
ncbi:TSUP family transporter [Nocardiopsis coralliicola]